MHRYCFKSYWRKMARWCNLLSEKSIIIVRKWNWTNEIYVLVHNYSYILLQVLIKLFSSDYWFKHKNSISLIGVVVVEQLVKWGASICRIKFWSIQTCVKLFSAQNYEIYNCHAQKNSTRHYVILVTDTWSIVEIRIWSYMVARYE